VGARVVVLAATATRRGRRQGNIRGGDSEGREVGGLGRRRRRRWLGKRMGSGAGWHCIGAGGAFGRWGAGWRCIWAGGAFGRWVCVVGASGLAAGWRREERERASG
jgi:hypothetical protein